ncbi:MAG: hypothetical protein ACLFSI_08730 [Halorhodospira sp.]
MTDWRSLAADMAREYGVDATYQVLTFPEGATEPDITEHPIRVLPPVDNERAPRDVGELTFQGGELSVVVPAASLPVEPDLEGRVEIFGSIWNVLCVAPTVIAGQTVQYRLDLQK